MNTTRCMLFVSVGSVMCACAAKAHPAPQPTVIEAVSALRLQAESRRCNDTTAVGDTIRAVITQGGDQLVPPQDSGTRALFVVERAVPGKLSGGDDGWFDLRPVALETASGRIAFRGPAPAIEPRIFSPPDSNIVYICVARGSLITFEMMSH